MIEIENGTKRVPAARFWRRQSAWRRLPLRLTLIAILGSVFPPATLAKRPFVIKPPPPWVKPLSVTQSGSAASNEAAYGSLYLLSDHQIRVNGGSTERYSRRVKKVLNASALEDVSQLQLEFEPSYQELVIHYVEIQRGDETIDALRPGEVKIIQQETDLYQRQYNGTLSALIFLNDVRVGDIVDYAFSVVGQNPVLGGRFADTFHLAATQAVEKLQWRLLWPSKRHLQYRRLNTGALPATQNLGEETEYTWEQENVAAIEFEDNTPGWFRPIPAVQLSEFFDWAGVVQWAMPLYALKRPIDGPLIKQIERWQAESADPEKRLLAALRFVQDDVRYMGIELGPYSHTPTQPSVVFDRRFGDCKDKSLLLTTILNSLGIEARPALVNTSAQYTLDEKSYWIDATASLQRGGLAELYNPNYARALVLREGGGKLEEIPHVVSEETTTTVREVYTVQNYQAPALLEVSTTYRNVDADGVRSWIAQQTLSELGKSYLNYYANFDPDIEATALPQISDDPTTNTIVITEKYTIPSFWKNKTRQFYAGRIDEELAKPSVSKRSMPLALSYPVRVSQTIEAHLPEPFTIERDSRTIESDLMRFKYQYGSGGNTITLNYQLRTLRDHVPADKVAKHLETVDRIRKTLGYEISKDGSLADANTGSLLPLALVLGPFLLFGIYKAVKSTRARRRQTSFKKQQARLAPGETPETAILLKGEAEISRKLAAFKCVCGISYSNEDGPPQSESAVFDGRRLTVIRLKCETCSTFQDVYFVAPTAGPTILQN